MTRYHNYKLHFDILNLWMLLGLLESFKLLSLQLRGHSDTFMSSFSGFGVFLNFTTLLAATQPIRHSFLLLVCV